MQTNDAQRVSSRRIVSGGRMGGALLLVTAVTMAMLSPFVLAAADKAESPSPASIEQQKQALAELNAFIGEWRGVGMPRRGSREGAWTEKAEWVWSFGKEGAAIDYKIDKGKQLQAGRVTWDAKRKEYRLAGTFADETSREYAGKFDDGKLVFESQPDDEGYVHLLTITNVNEKRSLVLYQKRREESKFLARVAEVGYTRAGTSLAVEGAGEIECIVTGGKGTMPVTYKGETYYVCCSGCKLAFDEDPEGVIAEYKQKLAERKKAQKGESGDD